MEELKALTNESLENYVYRLGTSKDKLKLSWGGISNLIKINFDKVLSKDAIRHTYYGMKSRDNIEVKKDDGYTKVLIINDLHLPYVKENIFEVFEANKDVDYILIAGDLVDCKSCSFFADFDKPSVEEELIIAHEFITKVDTIINPDKTKIIAIKGNHETRYTRDIMNLQEKQFQKLLNPNMLSMLQNGFNVYEKDKNIFYKPIDNFEYVNEFYLKLFGNLIIAHPTDFSNVEGSMCLKVADYFLNTGIAEKNDLIIFGHTHKHFMGCLNRRQGLYVIENACLCQDHEYSKSGKLSFTPQNYGYTILKFKEGNKINLNDIKFVHVD